MEMSAEVESNPISCGNFLPQWGIRKRMRCGKPQLKQTDAVTEKKSTIRVDRHVVRADKEAAASIIIPTQQDDLLQVKPALGKKIAQPCNNIFYSSPPRPQRGTRSLLPVNNIMCTRSSNNTEQINTIEDNKALNLEHFIWPKVHLTLSLSLIEEDFLAIKGSKLPLKPKKRLKSIQRAVHNASPGGWLNDISQERYEVREKKCLKK
ncbi:hypothetical protein KI387_010463, partial [Taxus chinensis]